MKPPQTLTSEQPQVGHKAGSDGPVLSAAHPAFPQLGARPELPSSR